ncbi:MAG TPA: DUF3617 family protein [Chakrabartia sp.]|jgi:hypothetical protein|nr:DUF3617 family protein [Chakrabartia sp.]
MASLPLPGLCILLLLSACGSAPDPEQGNDGSTNVETSLRLQPGRWQQMLLNGKPSIATESRCITPEEAQSANGSDAEIKAALERQMKQDGCTLGALSISGPTIRYSQTCSGTTMQIVSTYEGTRSVFVMSGGGMPPMTTESRRIGDCG